jgi:glycosyltransferase involved in cell wall biosynthesis
MTYKERLNALQCCVIIPTYNNASTIAQVIADVEQYADDIIVVNDGSTDDTSTILHKIDDIKLIEYSENKGKGYALKLGLRKATEWGYRYAITIDSDGQHYADDIPVFINKIEEKPDSLLIGARNLNADNMPSKNTFANRFSNFWYKVETGNTLADTQSGYRLYPLEKLKGIRFITRRYEFEVEVIVRAAWKGINVENVPIKVYYAPVEERVSHFRPLPDFTRISVLNTVLVLYAFLFYYPWTFLRSLTIANIKNFIDKQIIHSKDSNIRMAAAMGWGIFCGIIPIWGYQMLFAGFSAHFMKLNKIVAVVFSNISVPPMIPFLLYGSMVIGAFVLNIENAFSFSSVSLDTIGLGLWQYCVGSIILAILAGLSVFVISLFIMLLCKRGVRNE